MIIMKQLINILSSPTKRGAGFISDDRGLSTVEYVILLVLIAASCISLWVTFGEKLREKIEAANKEMDQVQIDGGNGSGSSDDDK